jgi:hypothetical protein
MTISAHLEPDTAHLKLDAVAERVRPLLLDLAEDIGALGARTARGLAPRLTGRYLLGLDHVVRTTGTMITVSIGSTDRKAHLVERGRNPGKMPPPRLIAAAMKPPGAEKLKPREAFALARAIGRRGTQGTAVMELTKRQIESQVHRMASRTAEKIGSLDGVK